MVEEENYRSRTGLNLLAKRFKNTHIRHQGCRFALHPNIKLAIPESCMAIPDEKMNARTGETDTRPCYLRRQSADSTVVGVELREGKRDTLIDFRFVI